MKKIAAALALVALAGCVNDTPVNSKPVQISASDKAIIEEGISRSLRDPSSAQFRDWQAYLLSNGHPGLAAGEVIGGTVNLELIPIIQALHDNRLRFSMWYGDREYVTED